MTPLQTMNRVGIPVWLGGVIALGFFVERPGPPTTWSVMFWGVWLVVYWLDRRPAKP